MVGRNGSTSPWSPEYYTHSQTHEREHTMAEETKYDLTTIVSRKGGALPIVTRGIEYAGLEDALRYEMVGAQRVIRKGDPVTFRLAGEEDEPTSYLVVPASEIMSVNVLAIPADEDLELEQEYLYAIPM